MEIDDEPHKVATMPATKQPGERYSFGRPVSNESDPTLRSVASAAYHRNTSETLSVPTVFNLTETSVIELWNAAANSNNNNNISLSNGTLNRQWAANQSVSATVAEATEAGVGSAANSTIWSFNNSHQITDVVSWWDVWMGKPFPSGYTQLAIVLLAFFLTCIMILVVVGNLLVCIAIATEKSLKPVQNWFIASLAVSDLFIGLVIMPFSLARELMGYWMFGQVWCDIHAALDVLLCTASINSLFLISLDRYWSITQAVKYLKKRTPSRAAFMIAFVWIFSALVSLPPLVGWKKAEQSSEYPQCNLSEDIGYVVYSSIGSFYFPALMMVFVYARIFIAARSRARRHIAKKRLKISAEPAPTEAAKEKSTTTTICTSFSNPSPPEHPNGQQELPPPPPESCSHNSTAVKQDDASCTKHSQPPPPLSLPVNSDSSIVQCPANTNFISQNLPLAKSPPPPKIIIEMSAESRRQSWNIISTSELISSIGIHNEQPLPVVACAELEQEKEESGNNGASYSHCNSLSSSCNPSRRPSNSNGSNDIKLATVDSNTNHNSRTYFPRLKSVSCRAFRFRKPKLNGLSMNSLSKAVTVDDDSDTADSPTSKEQPNYESKAFLSAPKLLRSKFGSSLSIADYEDSDLMEDDGKRKGKGRVQYHDPPVVGIHIPSDAERHKRKIAKARERRATLIVGLIMAAFITAWLPFFMLYLLAALCVTCKETIPEGVFAVAFWLGYCNSAANPIIYTIFNRDYRRAFRKILFK